jgi:hypothetical protein
MVIWFNNRFLHWCDKINHGCGERDTICRDEAEKWVTTSDFCQGCITWSSEYRIISSILNKCDARLFKFELWSFSIYLQIGIIADLDHSDHRVAGVARLTDRFEIRSQSSPIWASNWPSLSLICNLWWIILLDLSEVLVGSAPMNLLLPQLIHSRHYRLLSRLRCFASAHRRKNSGERVNCEPESCRKPERDVRNEL